jgi:anti-sigma B factor antagonist
MHVDVRKAGEVILVDLEGDLVAGDGDALLREVINELLAEGWKAILLNLAAIDRIDSSGVGEVVASWKLAREFGAAVKLLRPGDRVRHTLHLSQILPLIDVFEEEDPALSSFASS